MPHDFGGATCSKARSAGAWKVYDQIWEGFYHRPVSAKDIFESSLLTKSLQMIVEYQIAEGFDGRSF
jgi:hypothetical protein